MQNIFSDIWSFYEQQELSSKSQNNLWLQVSDFRQLWV